LIRPLQDSGYSDPGSMFAAAETVGRTVELDLACLTAVIEGARDMSPTQLLTVNISPRTVEAPHFSADALLAILAQFSISPGRVVVELTERETVEDGSRLQANLAALQRAGVRIAADDVGAGNAGLRLLSQIRFDIVKIDLSLVQEGAERDSSHAVLRSLRDLASRWGASVIAEGVETLSQLRTVREMGMAAGQGYLVGRPTTDTLLMSVDMAVIEAGGIVLERRPRAQTAAPPATAPMGAQIAAPMSAQMSYPAAQPQAAS
jgi:EAL domain-containing protein (putative c-di-GMP-specific phosphodiesterase class I)